MLVLSPDDRWWLHTNILDQSGSETENDGSTFIEYEYDEEVPPYMKLRLNNIAEREAAMKAAEEAGLF